MDINAYISSGVLERFVLGTVSAEEAEAVQRYAKQYPQIQQELNAIETALQAYGEAHAPAKAPTSKEVLQHITQYEQSLPPEITAQSTIGEYATWLNDSSIQPPKDFENLHAHPIGKRPGSSMFILWIRHHELEHEHHDRTEAALVVEGTCIMTLNGVATPYGPGDVAIIPPFSTHAIEVTSSTPMKAVFMVKAG